MRASPKPNSSKSVIMRVTYRKVRVPSFQSYPSGSNKHIVQYHSCSKFKLVRAVSPIKVLNIYRPLKSKKNTTICSN